MSRRKEPLITGEEYIVLKRAIERGSDRAALRAVELVWNITRPVPGCWDDERPVEAEEDEGDPNTIH
jgi:hypothetical protein